MTKSQKQAIVNMVTREMRWMYDHPEYNVPQWYINLLESAQFRLAMRDYRGAAHDITQAIEGRESAMKGVV